jgi:2-amino-4-hydroxy-6-hydroxymethyldihydropteridine diphosphokinase
MSRAFVSLGSNINPADNIEAAVRILDGALRVMAISTVYLTEPVGGPGQAAYYNCVVEVETDTDPVFLKQEVLRRIETKLGRLRSNDKFAARMIDLDLVLYDDLALTTEDLQLPDPDILRRPFLAIPLQELAPGLLLPGSGASIDTVASALSKNTMTPLDRFTEHLRKDVLHDRKE